MEVAIPVISLCRIRIPYIRVERRFLSFIEHVEVAIPYDKGFTITVDGKETKYQESIQNGIIFKIPKGKHKIEMIYKSPWKDIASMISIIGILLWIGIIIKERKRT